MSLWNWLTAPAEKPPTLAWLSKEQVDSYHQRLLQSTLEDVLEAFSRQWHMCVERKCWFDGRATVDGQLNTVEQARIIEHFKGLGWTAVSFQHYPAPGTTDIQLVDLPGHNNGTHLIAGPPGTRVDLESGKRVPA